MDAFVQRNGDAGQPATPKGAKGSIEKTYQKKSQLEHILLRPDSYIGSVETVKEPMWVFDKEEKRMRRRDISYVPGLYKIYDEILVNAADHKQRDPKMTLIKVEINQETNTISVFNNGEGIPVVMHKEEKMYVPTMIFGHLLTSSNYNDEEEKVTGGRNGYGAKLCNIYSTKFMVETASKKYKSQFKQAWSDNMRKASEAKVSPIKDSEFTKITFSPDLVRFKMEKLDDDIVALMSRRAYDIAASTKGVSVFLNGEKIPVKNFKDYMELYVPKDLDTSMGGGNKPLIYEQCGERWEVGFTMSDRGFQQVSFVNSIATTKGGRHVDYVADMIVKHIVEILDKKNKGGTKIKPFQIKNHMWVFVNCLIVNPTFDSQTKETMTSLQKNFGSKCALGQKFLNGVDKSGIVQSVLNWAKFKESTELQKTSGKKNTKVKGIPKLEDANDAGSKHSIHCTLILTEGDSAKALAVSGLAVVGRDRYGIFPLRGKLLNVREANHKQILENAEISNLIKIVGLQYSKKYHTPDDLKQLRYGKIMIMTDQDQDGSHIKGLLINFIHTNWPELLRLDFLEEFITPIVKATHGSDVISFYSLPEFNEWREDNPNAHKYKIKYYKGLGTSTSIEAREYFEDMERHRIVFKYAGTADDEAILMAFSKKCIDQRKEWLTNFMVDSKRRKELGLPERYLYTKGTKEISYSDFVNLELVLFSNLDNERSIPCIVDGFKPGQRKIMYTCFATKKLEKNEMKVAQLSGLVAHTSEYHHGEQSLCQTIINLAQNFVGSNNINLLLPSGSFGTRLNGGKDSASPRYIFTQLTQLARMIFHPLDDPILTYLYEDNHKIEPQWYIPIIPMVLVNGAEGIGTGWSTKIPNHNPRDLIKSIRNMINGEEPLQINPWYKNFRGTIEKVTEFRYLSIGNIAILEDDRVEITELPVGVWTQAYKENTLEVLSNSTDKTKAIITDYREYNTDTTVRFTLQMAPGELEKVRNEPGGLHRVLKLFTPINTSCMHAFDSMQCLKKYNTVMDIMKEHYEIRLKYYQLRKDYMVGSLEAVANQLSFKAKFIEEKCNNTIIVENKKKQIIINELIKRGYPSDPLLEWKKKNQVEDAENDGEDEEGAAADVKPGKAEQDKVPSKGFDYLLGMSMWYLTDEKRKELLKDRDAKLAELNALKSKTIQNLWLDDLEALEKKLDEVEEIERMEAAGVNVKKKKGAKNQATPSKGRAKKKDSSKESAPAELSEKIDFIVTNDLKVKFEKLSGGGAPRVKKEKPEKVGDANGDIDDIDALIAKKPKKAAAEKVKKEPKPKKEPGLKQAKLDFSGSKKGKGRKKKTSDDEDDLMEMGDNSDVEFDVKNIEPSRDRPSARAASKKITYKFSDDEEKSDSELEMFDNTVETEHKAETVKLSDSEEDEPKKKNDVSADDMFESLKKTTKPAAKPAAKRKPKEGSSEDDLPKKAPKKSKKALVSDDDFSPVKKTTKKKSSKKMSSDEDFTDSDF